MRQPKVFSPSPDCVEVCLVGGYDARDGGEATDSTNETAKMSAEGEFPINEQLNEKKIMLV